LRNEVEEYLLLSSTEVEEEVALKNIAVVQIFLEVFFIDNF